MGRMREPKDLLDKINELEKRVKSLETNARAGYTSVDAGAMRVNTSDESKFQIYIEGTKQVEIGASGGAPEMRFWRANGLTAFFMTRFADRDIIGFQDNSLHTIVGDDAVTGFGLSRPWLTIPFYDDHQFAPARTTTNASFVNLQWAMYNIQHPFVFVTSLVRASDGTTGGDIILRVNGTNVNASITPIPVGSNTLFTASINFAYYGIAYGTDVELIVAARRTAGSGTIGVRTVHAYGRETPL